MKSVYFILISMLYLSPFVSIAEESKKTNLSSKVELLLKTNVKYIDKKNDAEKIYYAITFEVYIINKTKKDLVIPSLDNDLRFYINYESTHNKDFLKKPLFTLPSLLFFAGGEVLLKANSYAKMEFEYSITEDVFNRYITSDKYNILQVWCTYLEKNKIKSNIVNIPIISHGQQGKTSDKKSAK